jgi:hypothetical protein
MDVRVHCAGTVSRVDPEGIVATVDEYEFVREAPATQAATAAA